MKLVPGHICVNKTQNTEPFFKSHKLIKVRKLEVLVRTHGTMQASVGRM